MLEGTEEWKEWGFGEKTWLKYTTYLLHDLGHGQNA